MKQQQGGELFYYHLIKLIKQGETLFYHFSFTIQ